MLALTTTCEGATTQHARVRAGLQTGHVRQPRVLRLVLSPPCHVRVQPLRASREADAMLALTTTCEGATTQHARVRAGLQTGHVRQPRVLRLVLSPPCHVRVQPLRASREADAMLARTTSHEGAVNHRHEECYLWKGRAKKVRVSHKDLTRRWALASANAARPTVSAHHAR